MLSVDVFKMRFDLLKTNQTANKWVRWGLVASRADPIFLFFQHPVPIRESHKTAIICKKWISAMLSGNPKTSFIFSITLLCLISAFGLMWSSTTYAQDSTAFIRQVRSIETDELGIINPSSLAFSPDTNIFYILSQNQPKAQAADIFLLTPTEDRIGSARIAAQINDPINMTFDFTAKRLLLTESAEEMIEFGLGSDGNLNTNTPVRHDIRIFGLKDPLGMTVDPESGHLFILDATDLRIVRVETGPGGGFNDAVITPIDLKALDLVNPRGLALDPNTGHFHVLSTDEKMLYELTEAGLLVATRDLSAFKLNDPQGMVFAPSGDLTDDPSQLSLYIADSGLSPLGEDAPNPANNGQVVELSLAETLLLAVRAAVGQGSLVQVIDTSQFSPPSPDSAGIAYLSASDTLLMSDSEVNEMPIFTGDNLFEMTLSGNLINTLTTISFSNEPTGVAYNPANEHIFISDDSAREIFEVNPGPDGLYDTDDDIVTAFDTRAFDSTDPEGVAFDSWQGVLFIADGLNNEIYRVSPGSNGIFDGLPPGGDDSWSSFDTGVLGVNDPEGITFDTDNGLLYIVGDPSDSMAHVTREGALVRMVDISAANARKPAGLGYAPSSVIPSAMNIYITERGVDNNSDPNENDGRVYEISISPTLSGNLPPLIDAGSNTAITLPEVSVFLDATVTDDGLPDPPGAVTINWSQVSGPGTVIFDNASVEDTWATFPGAGVYILSLTASDSEFMSTDELIVTVIDPTVGSIDVRVADSSDDAEERSSGSMYLTSSDLELVFDGSDQTVGMRFNVVGVPQGALITNAYIQFQVDEINTVATSLTIEGEDIDDALNFTPTSGNISSRPRTGTTVSWDPVPWTTQGEVGLDQQTPNIASIIQEIVDRPGWTIGNSLVIIITGTGERTAESYDGVMSGAPLLHVEYTVTADTTPVAVDDAFTVNEDLPLAGNVLDDNGNGPDTLGDGINTVSLVSDVSNGTLTLNPDGSFDYTPALDFNGADSFTYHITDEDPETSNTATASITVDPVDDGTPVAVDDALSTPEDVPKVINIDNDLLANDTLTDRAVFATFDTLSVQGGPVVDNGDGTLTYSPPLNYNGPDSFTYSLIDDEGQISAAATVDITVSVVFCDGDFDQDGDIDGMDLFELIQSGGVSPADFAANFGRAVCP